MIPPIGRAGKPLGIVARKPRLPYRSLNKPAQLKQTCNAIRYGRVEMVSSLLSPIGVNRMRQKNPGAY